jgi:hypothetical protein
MTSKDDIKWLVSLSSFVHEQEPRQPLSLAGWGRTLPLDSMRVDWYLPAAQELGVVRGLVERYLLPLLASLDRCSLIMINID